MAITYRDQNILDFEENLMIQQVNHMGLMGGGLALETRNMYRFCAEPYAEFCRDNKWDTIKDNGLFMTFLINNDFQQLCFVFGQRGVSAYRPQTDYLALKNGLVSVAKYAKEFSYNVAIPFKLGCGLAGGDWGIVLPIIEESFDGVNVCIYKWSKYSGK